MPRKSSVTGDSSGDNSEQGLDYILSLLEGVTRAGDDGYKAVCPAHDDREPSLSVTRKHDNAGRLRVFLECKSGCAFTDVTQELGLRKLQMFEPGELDSGAAERRARARVATTPTRRSTAKSRKIAEYPYEGPDGAVLFTQVRYEPKDFRTDPAGFPADQRVPFRLPQLIAGVKAGKRIWIVEGEKDVLALEAAGEVATCNPGGALAWHSRYARWFEGANVSIVRDKDEAGTKFVLSVASTLENVAKSVKVFEPWVESSEHADVSDHLGAGWKLSQLVRVDLAQLATAAREAQEEADAAKFKQEAAEYARRLRIQEAGRRLNAEQGQRPIVVKPFDALVDATGEYLIKGRLPLGGVGELTGASGAYKSFALIDAMMHIAAGLPFWHGARVRQGNVLFVAAEGGGGIRRRVEAWLVHHGYYVPKRRADLKAVLAAIRFIDEPINVLAPGRLLAAIEDGWPVSLIVLDTRLNVTPGLDPIIQADNKQVLLALQQLTLETGATVLSTHHSGVMENNLDRGKGDQTLHDNGDFAWHAVGDQDEGLRCTLQVRKIKEGEQHKFGLRLEVIHLNRVDSDGDPITSLAVVDTCEPGEAASARDMARRMAAAPAAQQKVTADRHVELAYKLQVHAQANPGCTSAEAERALGIGAPLMKKVRELAVEEGLIRIESGPNNGKLIYPED